MAQSEEIPGDVADGIEAGPAFDLWLEFEHWVPSPDDDPEDDFCNVAVTLGAGERYALNVWTFRYLDRARREDAATGENLGGRYLAPPDLLVERLDRQTVEAVIQDLVRTGGLRPEWRVSDADDAAGTIGN